MRITQEKEIDLKDFEAWSGGKDTLIDLKEEEINFLQDFLESAFTDGMDEVELNDFLWFERDYIADLLGFNNFDEIIERNRE